MILVGYRHGLRASELCDLQWSQVNARLRSNTRGRDDGVREELAARVGGCSRSRRHAVTERRRPSSGGRTPSPPNVVSYSTISRLDG
jgi:integrase